MSLDASSIVNVFVRSSLNLSLLHIFKVKSFFKYLKSSWYKAGVILFGDITSKPSGV